MDNPIDHGVLPTFISFEYRGIRGYRHCVDLQVPGRHLTIVIAIFRPHGRPRFTADIGRAVDRRCNRRECGAWQRNIRCGPRVSMSTVHLAQDPWCRNLETAGAVQRGAGLQMGHLTRGEVKIPLRLKERFGFRRTKQTVPHTRCAFLIRCLWSNQRWVAVLGKCNVYVNLCILVFGDMPWVTCDLAVWVSHAVRKSMPSRVFNPLNPPAHWLVQAKQF
jgi:hypothetical protein